MSYYSTTDLNHAAVRAQAAIKAELCGGKLPKLINRQIFFNAERRALLGHEPLLTPLELKLIKAWTQIK